MTRDLGRDAKTAVALWARRVAESGDEVAFRYKEAGSWVTMTWKQTDVAAREIAAGLVAAGVGPGDRVCLLSQTRIEWMLCDVASLLLGALIVPIYATNTADQCAFILRDCDARLVIVEDATQLEKVLSVLGEAPGVKQIFHFGGDVTLDKPDAAGRTQVRLEDVVKSAAGRSGLEIRSFADLRASGRTNALPPGELDRRGAAVTSETLFTIIYTSGTTGTPKGVVLTHGNVTAAVAAACRALTLHPQDEQLLFLPMAHVLGRELAWIVVQAGIATWFAESLLKLKDNLLEARPTYLVGVPRIFEKLYGGVQRALSETKGLKAVIGRWALGVGKEVSRELLARRQVTGLLALKRWLADRLVFSKLRARLGLDRCRFLVSGAAPLAAEIGEFFHGVGVLILEGYGLSETVGAAFLNRLDGYRFGTVGKAFDVVEVKIAGDGEVLMRGPTVFPRYYNNAAATAESIDAEGWFHSGDIGQLEDDYLRITDRKKDLIVTAGGKKVAPQPIENSIKAHTTLVSQAVVFGDKRPYCVALLTPSEDALKKFGATNGTLSDVAAMHAEVGKVVERMNAGLAPYETIKAFSVLPGDFTEAAGELTPSLKVKRKVVVDKYRDVIEGLYKNARVAADA